MIRSALFAVLVTVLAASSTFALLVRTPQAEPAAGTPAASPRADPMPVASRYLEAYSRFDVAAMQTFWDERSVFQDPTSAEIGPAFGPVRGAQAIADALRGATQGLADFSLHFDERFHSGGYVIAMGRLKYTLLARTLGRAEGDVPFDVRVVTVLRVDGEKVVEHTDYTDLSGWRAKVEAATR